MSFKLHSTNKTDYIEADSDDFVLQNEEDILTLVAACLENGASNVLLYEDNFSSDFFDLSTRLAGELFQKLANYRLRGAGVISLEKIKSDRFKELIVESNRGQLFRFFEEKAAAEKWLAGR